MFTDAIERVSRFTRPIHNISRLYNSTEAIPGTATLFLVNNEGWAITCKHVVELLITADRVNTGYHKFKDNLIKLEGASDFETKKAELEHQFHYNRTTTIETQNRFINCVNKLSGFDWHVHPMYDLALLKFKGFNKLHCSEFPVFQSDENYLKQGKFLCRLGYPFPEFTNFKYNNGTDKIEWTSDGILTSPMFPIEGMITRFLGDGTKSYGIELSTPGLRGQSGGPLFDNKGIIQGMQFATKHLHLGFDIEDKKIQIKGQKKHINDYPFIHLGHCIHVSVIKEFMAEKGIRFNEA